MDLRWMEQKYRERRKQLGVGFLGQKRLLGILDHLGYRLCYLWRRSRILVFVGCSKNLVFHCSRILASRYSKILVFVGCSRILRPFRRGDPLVGRSGWLDRIGLVGHNRNLL